jgi:hypothetical protein
MTTSAFQASVIAKLRLGLRSASAKLDRFRQASAEALRLCASHPERVPDGAVAAFEDAYRDLWRSPGKGDRLKKS